MEAPVNGLYDDLNKCSWFFVFKTMLKSAPPHPTDTESLCGLRFQESVRCGGAGAAETLNLEVKPFIQMLPSLHIYRGWGGLFIYFSQFSTLACSVCHQFTRRAELSLLCEETARLYVTFRWLN